LEGLAQELRVKYPGINVTATKCDVSDVEDIARAFAAAERAVGTVFDVVVNNAGIGPVVKFMVENPK